MMATLKTQEVMLPSFDYLSPEVVQRSVDRTYLEEMRPLAEIAKGKPIEFALPPSNDYTALHDVKLEVTVKLTGPNGANLDYNAANNALKLCVANNFMHTIFSNFELFINGEAKENAGNNNYPIRAYLDKLTSTRHDVFAQRGVLEGWAKDTEGRQAVYLIDGDNAGMASRTAPFRQSAEVTMIGKIHSDIMSQGLCIPPKILMLIRFTPSADRYALIAPAAPDAANGHGEVVITRARLLVPRVRTAPSLALAHAKMFASHNLVLPMRKVGVKNFTIPAGTVEATLTNMFPDVLPDRFLIGFLSNDSRAGTTYASNPFNFQHFGVIRLQAHVGEHSIPSVAYTPNFATGKYIREYYELLEEFNAEEGVNTLAITKTEFASGSTLFPFRITERSRGGDILGPPLAGALSLSIQFAAALAENVNVVVYYEVRSVLEIPLVK